LKKPSTLVAAIWFAVLVLIWGTTWAAIRVGLEGIPPFTGAFLRFASASALLLLLAPKLGADLRGDRRTWLVWIASGISTFTISYGVVYWAEQWVPSALASILFATFPLMVVLGALVLLPGERLRPKAMGGIVLGFLGVVVIFSEDLSRIGGEHVMFASIVFMLSPLSSAIGSVIVKRWGKGIHPVAMTAVPMAIGAFALGIVALVFERGRPLHFTPLTVGSIAYLAFVGTALAFTVYFWLLAHYSATKLSLITYGTPVVAVIVGMLVMGEAITPRVLAGAAIVISGVALAGRR
jgi:drug/metabolite transporter (DMT)-like permease